jgi:hypothetical protein
LPSPRGDPARLGSLSADPPLVVLLLLLLHSSSAPYHFPFLFCNTRWGRVASTSCRSESSNISLVVLDGINHSKKTGGKGDLEELTPCNRNKSFLKDRRYG